MVELLRQSVREGGLGFSTSLAATHNDGAGDPVPSRHASREELIALARAIRDLPGTVLEAIPGTGLWGEKEKAIMADLSLAANRPLNWNVLAPNSLAPQHTEHQLSASDYAAERGAVVVALTPPAMPTVRINLASGFIFDAFPGWDELFRLPIEERKRKLRDPAFRRKLDEGAHSEGAGLLRGLARWENLIVDQVARPEHDDAARPQDRRDRGGARQGSPSTACSTSRSPRTCSPRSCRRRSATTRRAGSCARRSGATRARWSAPRTPARTST